MAYEWEVLANDPEVKPMLVRQVEGRELSRTYMRHAERTSEGAEVAAIERRLTDPVERRFLQNPGKLGEQNLRRKKNLLAQSPPTDLTASQRDKLARLERVTQAFVAENMPTTEQMRHNPPGAVDHHRAWDRHAKPALLVWKNVRIILNPDSDAVDLANFERYRPANAATRNLFPDGQIPGQWALGEHAKANYDRIDFSNPEVAAQIQAAIDHGEFKVRVRGTPAQGRQLDTAEFLSEAEIALLKESRRTRLSPSTASLTEEQLSAGRRAGALSGEPERQSKEQRRLGRQWAKETRQAKTPQPVTATCESCGVEYRGVFGASNLKRHTAQRHGVREEAPA